MVEPVAFYDLHGDPPLAAALAARIGGVAGRLERRRFPDGETYVRLEGPAEGYQVVLCGSLADPDGHFFALAFAARTARDLGAKRVLLAAPYFAYMRQDARFQPGEPISALYFCELLGTLIDGLITVDPHLHRISALSEVLSVPARTVQAAPALARWIETHVEQPLLVGPDTESRQWVNAVAEVGGFEYIIMEKQRYGDRDVSVSGVTSRMPEGVTPVIVDDIAASGRTLVAAVEACIVSGVRAPVCAVVHALCGDADVQAVRTAGAAGIVATNTTPHPLGEIDVNALFADGVERFLAEFPVDR